MVAVAAGATTEVVAEAGAGAVVRAISSVAITKTSKAEATLTLVAEAVATVRSDKIIQVAVVVVVVALEAVVGATKAKTRAPILAICPCLNRKVTSSCVARQWAADWRATPSSW